MFKGKVDVFLASSWGSIAPGEDWFGSIIMAIERADLMLVLASGDSVGRPWIQFETGAGWFAKKTKVIPVCHKGMTPAALPEPIRRLQAVDINAGDEAERLRKLADAIRHVADLPEPAPVAVEALPLPSGSKTAPSLKGWVLRPASHIDEEIEDVFKVGAVGVADSTRAQAAGLDPNDALYVRLFVEPPNGQYVNTMAVGSVAAFFESDEVLGAVVKAKIRLRSTFHESADCRAVPIITIEATEKRPV